MPVDQTCPDCGKRYRFRDEFLGKRVACKACSQTFVVRAAKGTKSNSKFGKKLSLLQAIEKRPVLAGVVGLGGGVLVIALIAGLFSWTRSRTPETPTGPQASLPPKQQASSIPARPKNVGEQAPDLAQKDPDWLFDELWRVKPMRDDANAAVQLLKASSMLPQISKEEVERLLPKLPTRALAVDSLKGYQAPSIDGLAEARKLAEFRTGRFAVAVGPNIFDTRVDHLLDCRNVLRHLEIDALQHAVRGDGDKSIESILAMMGVCRSLNQEPIAISQVYRWSCPQRVGIALLHCLRLTSPSDESLDKMQKVLLEEIQTYDGLTLALLGERAAWDKAMALGIQNQLDWSQVPSSGGPFDAAAATFFRTQSYSYFEQALAFRRNQSPSRIALDQRYKDLEMHMSPFAPGRAEGIHLSNANSLRSSWAHSLAHTEMAYYLVSLEKHRRTKGDFPPATNTPDNKFAPPFKRANPTDDPDIGLNFTIDSVNLVRDPDRYTLYRKK